jgi:ankyrin repeat protein
MRLRHLVTCVVIGLGSAFPATGVNAAGDSSAVADAARAGDVRTVDALVKQRADVNGVQADGTTALHWAVRNSNLRMVDALLAAGAHATAANRYGVTPLSLAAGYGDAAAIDRLLKAGADPNGTVAEGQTMLMLAARSGQIDAVTRLLAAGARVNDKEKWMGETALMWAAAENNTSTVVTLLERGADINARSTSVAYPAQKPADPSNYVGSFVPKGQWTALMYAARENAAESAQALIDHGADINVQDPEGVTPLLEAIVNLHYDLAAMLLQKGADAKLADKAGMTPLFAVVEMRTPAWERSRPRSKERDRLDGIGLMTLLLDRGADANATLKGRQLTRYHAGGSAAFGDGTTALMQAARYNHLDIARLLVDRGADVSLAQPDGTTALMIAAGVKYALTQEGDPDNMGTPDEALEIVRLLVDRGADVKAANAKGETALYGAAFVGRDRVIQFLADRGARFDAVTRTGLTILDGALNTGVSDEGTGSRVGGKPGPATIGLVRELSVKAGVAPAAKATAERVSIHAVAPSTTAAAPK